MGQVPDEEARRLSTKLFRLRYLKDYMLRPTIDELGLHGLTVLTSALSESIYAHVSKLMILIQH